MPFTKENKKSALFHSWSFWSILITWCILAFFRFNPYPDKPISWDVLGYYLPIASTVIHQDPLLTNSQWLVQLNEEEKLTGTLYQLTTAPDGRKMYFFFFGWSYCYAPFFALGHWAAIIFDFEVNGFSPPYQIALMMGGLVYIAIALWFWRKILNHFFDDRVTATTILIIAIGSNFISQTSIDNLSTVNLLFTLLSILVWNTIQWYKNLEGKNLVFILVAWILMTLIKPSEILVALIPIFWKVEWLSPRTYLTAFRLALSQPKALILGGILVLALLSPQMIYWKVMTGSWIFDSYQNPGIGLDLASPHIMEVLFSFRKGWFLYTPIMVLCCVGWIRYWKLHARAAGVFGLYFLVSFYIAASWSEWWYGGSFSQRPLVTMYAILSLNFAAVIHYLQNKRVVIKILASVFICCLIGLNQFQWWQFRVGILDPYRTTSGFYRAIWLKTSVDPSLDSLKLVRRDFEGKSTFDSANYTYRELSSVVFEKDMSPFITDEWYNEAEFVFEDLTTKDHVYLRANCTIQCYCSLDSAPLFVFFSKHKGVYGYLARPFSHTNEIGLLNGEFMYMSPEMRNTKDKIGYQIWNRFKVPFRLIDSQITLFEPNSIWAQRD
jgi:hypothetical protein